MKLGVVKVLHEYVVDLDDSEQVKRAKEFLCKDIAELTSRTQNGIEAIIGTIENLDVTDEDPDDEVYWLVADPIEYLNNHGSYGVVSMEHDLWEDPGGHVVTTDMAIECERSYLLEEKIRELRG